MEDCLHSFMKVGLVHFMAYPEAAKSRQALLASLAEIAEDPFFDAIELTSVPDDDTRATASLLLTASHIKVGFAAQPVLLDGRFDLNSVDARRRQLAVEAVKACLDEAVQLGAGDVTLLSGPDVTDGRERALALLVTSLQEICAYGQSKGNVQVILEVFDRTVDKKRLVGSTEDAVHVAERVKLDHPNFGLMLDLSHLPLMAETPAQALGAAREHLVHVHLGNCVLSDKGHPAFGDRHPRFGIEGGENDVAEVREFLKQLVKIGYVAAGSQRVVAFEVRPLPGETTQIVIANAKRTLREAWACL